MFNCLKNNRKQKTKQRKPWHKMKKNKTKTQCDMCWTPRHTDKHK